MTPRMNDMKCIGKTNFFHEVAPGRKDWCRVGAREGRSAFTNFDLSIPQFISESIHSPRTMLLNAFSSAMKEKTCDERLEFFSYLV